MTDKLCFLFMLSLRVYLILNYRRGYVSVWLCAHECRCPWAFDHLGTAVTGGCESPDSQYWGPNSGLQYKLSITMDL